MGPQDVGVSSHWLCRVLSQSMALEFPLSKQHEQHFKNYRIAPGPSEIVVCA